MSAGSISAVFHVLVITSLIVAADAVPFTAPKALVTIREYYRAILESKDLSEAGALRAHYDTARLAILARILGTTPNGYRAGDARFLIGWIYWKRGLETEAIRWWRTITIDPADKYAASYSALLEEIRTPMSDPPLTRRIARILDAEQGRWLMSSFDRLRQFGYRFDTY